MALTIADAAGAVTEFTVANLLQTRQGRELLSCIQCGICAGTCPYGEVMDYPPRRIIGMLRAGLLEKVFASDSLLFCVACYACMAKCPRGHPAHRGAAAADEGADLRPPAGAARRAAEGAAEHAALRQPDGRVVAQAGRLGEDLPGAGSDPRRRIPARRTCCGSWSATRPTIRAARTTRGPRPRSSTRWGSTSPSSATRRSAPASAAGSPGRPGLFETLMDYNMAIFEQYQFNRIVTSCPHAYNAFKHPLPDARLRLRGRAHHAVSSPATSTR